jgi:riboflavin synthase
MQVAAPPAMVRPAMFTGIVTDVGRVRSLTPARQGRDTRLVIETAYDTGAIDRGASISCAGCCLTVVEKGAGWFAVDASGETLSKSTLGTWRAGRRLNLERPLKLGDELGGHIVSGHVDTVARLVERAPEAGSTRFVIELGDGFGRYIASKGSVAVDGVSLTVNELSDTAGVTRFGVNIIPHTLTVTTFGDLKPGDGVNLEVDMLARYVARLNERT